METNDNSSADTPAGVKQRLGRSPNYADALFNTFALPDQPSNSRIGFMIQRQPGKALTEFDPYRDEDDGAYPDMNLT